MNTKKWLVGVSLLVFLIANFSNAYGWTSEEGEKWRERQEEEDAAEAKLEEARQRRRQKHQSFREEVRRRKEAKEREKSRQQKLQQVNENNPLMPYIHSLERKLLMLERRVTVLESKLGINPTSGQNSSPTPIGTKTDASSSELDDEKVKEEFLDDFKFQKSSFVIAKLGNGELRYGTLRQVEEDINKEINELNPLNPGSSYYKFESIKGVIIGQLKNVDVSKNHEGIIESISFKIGANRFINGSGVTKSYRAVSSKRMLGDLAARLSKLQTGDIVTCKIKFPEQDSGSVGEGGAFTLTPYISKGINIPGYAQGKIQVEKTSNK